MKMSKETKAEAGIAVNMNDLFTGPESGDSFDNSPVVFLSEAGKYARDLEGLEKYIESEIKRLASEKRSLVKALLTNRHNLALVPSKLLFSKISEMGISHVYLKLTDVCDAERTAPDKDPHGALLNEKYRGRVLVAKLGNKGGDIQNSENADAFLTDKFTGKRRQALFSQRTAYETANVTVNPTKFPLNKAILIMSQWGFGIKEKRHISKATSKTDKTPIFQDCWIVEECNFDQTYQDLSTNPTSNLLI